MTTVPISDLKDATTFAKTVAQAGEPVVVTRNGYEELVVLHPSVFRSYRKETPEEHLDRLLTEADQDLISGRVADALEGIEEIRKSYGL